MADEENTDQEKTSKESNLLGLIGYALFFIMSFIATFSVLYISLRGFQHPFKSSSQTGDSTAVAVDSSKINDAESEKEQNEKLLTDKVNKLVQEKLIDKEGEVEELRYQIETLKFVYQENQRKYKELIQKSVSKDSLSIIVTELESEQKNVEKKEVQIAELDSVTKRLKHLIEKTGIGDTTIKIHPDSVKKVLAELEQEKEVQKKQQQDIENLQQKIDDIETDNKNNKLLKENKNIKRLAKVYESMKAADAAEIMKNLDNNLVVKIIAQIKQRKAAKILAELSPQRAAKISKALGEL